MEVIIKNNLILTTGECNLVASTLYIMTCNFLICSNLFILLIQKPFHTCNSSSRAFGILFSTFWKKLGNDIPERPKPLEMSTCGILERAVQVSQIPPLCLPSSSSDITTIMVPAFISHLNNRNIDTLFEKLQLWKQIAECNLGQTEVIFLG